MLLLVEKGVRCGIRSAIQWYANVYNKDTWKIIIKIKNLYILTYNFYGWAIPQKLPLDGVGWVQNISQFKKYFIEKYKEDSDEGHFLEIDIYYPEKFYGFHNDLNYLPKRMKVERVGKRIANLHDKKKMLYTYQFQNKH